MAQFAAADAVRERHYDLMVSYCRRDDDQRSALVAALEARGYDVFWDAKLGPARWRTEWEQRMRACTLVVVLWSAEAMNSDEVKHEAGGALILGKCLSVPLDGRERVPAPFREVNHFVWDRGASDATRQQQLARILAKVEGIVGPPRRAPEPAGGAIPVRWGDIPGAPPRLIGRDAELAVLRAAWDSRPPHKVNAVVFHALGGAGKSALLRTFANQLLAEGGGGAARIYGWSAYSQGSGEQKRADADGFVSQALTDLGFTGQRPKDPVERARALARLVQGERVLLLLDGLEPLQDPPGVNKGRFKDKGLAELVKTLADQNPGLMVLSTRQEVQELDGRQPLVRSHALEQLTDPAGAELLVELGVRGRQRELEAAVHTLQGHALSVTLLGTYLAEVCGGDVRHADQFDFAGVVLTAAEQEALATDATILPAQRAAKVMRGYLEQFEKLDAAAGQAGPERALLHLLGLFDRPADGAAVEVLLAEPIPGLTDDLFTEVETTTAGWWLCRWTKRKVRELTPAERGQRIRGAKERMRKLRLLGKPNPKDPHELDAHPVVRAFFAGRLAETAPEAARAAHERLYRHYAAEAPDLPDTLAAMEPLFHAVAHGVRAERAQEVYDEVFRQRIRRENEHYLTRIHGAFGPQLVLLAHFFEVPWRTPRALHPGVQAWLWSAAASALTALGRLADAIEPRRAGMEASVRLGDWKGAAVDGCELSNALLTLGRVPEALAAAQAALAHAERSGDADRRQSARAWLAVALTAAGDRDAATARFAEAEALESHPDLTGLVSVNGYQYGDLLLDGGAAAEVLERGRYQLDVAQRGLGRGMGLHNLGLAQLLIGRAEDALDRPEAGGSFDAAVTGLRKAGQAGFVPWALLARAAHRRRRAAAGEVALLEGLRADLAEVEDLAGDEMRLHLTDLALERARLALDVPAAFPSPAAAHAEAAAQLARAAQLVAETGYHRRDPDLAELTARLR